MLLIDPAREVAGQVAGQLLGLADAAPIAASDVTDEVVDPPEDPSVSALPVERLIDRARVSVVCSSYNFSPASRMWTALRAASERDGVAVTVYLDANKSDTDAVAAHLPRATVFRPTTLPGTSLPIVNHAKFVIIDQTIVLLTSANFSHSAEHSNIELGLLVADAGLAESIESLLRAKHGVLYERV